MSAQNRVERTHPYLLPPATGLFQCLAYDGVLWTISTNYTSVILVDDRGYPVHYSYSTDRLIVDITWDGVKTYMIKPSIWK